VSIPYLYQYIDIGDMLTVFSIYRPTSILYTVHRTRRTSASCVPSPVLISNIQGDDNDCVTDGHVDGHWSLGTKVDAYSVDITGE